MHLCFFKYIFLLIWRIIFVWAELALNESKQGIIRNQFTFFLLFLFLCNGSIIIRCASGRGGKAPHLRGGLAVRLAQRRTERCCKVRFEVGPGLSRELGKRRDSSQLL